MWDIWFARYKGMLVVALSANKVDFDFHPAARFLPPHHLNLNNPLLFSS